MGRAEQWCRVQRGFCISEVSFVIEVSLYMHARNHIQTCRYSNVLPIYKVYDGTMYVTMHAGVIKPTNMHAHMCVGYSI